MFGAQSLDCIVVLVGPVARAKPCLMGVSGALPALILMVVGTGWTRLML